MIKHHLPDDYFFYNGPGEEELESSDASTEHEPTRWVLELLTSITMTNYVTLDDIEHGRYCF